MPRGADFPSNVIEALANRAGHRCSFPGCSMDTSGPSAEGPMKFSRTGDAAHIVAASSGRVQEEPTMAGYPFHS